MADFTGTTGDDTQDGTAANETFDYSQGGKDFLRGLEGNDIFLMGAALDVGDSIHGGAGNDEVVLDGDYNLSFAAETIVNVETLRLTAGHDYTMDTAEENILAGKTLTIDASALGADDVLIFHGFAETDGMFSITAGAGADTIVGGDKDDFIDGGAGDDSLGGGDGNDRLSGHEGVDNIFGGAGDDSIGGGDADDNLYGGDDNDTITDTKGNNHLYGEAGDDTLTGGSGNDTLDGGTGVNTINGMGGDDTIAAVNADQAFGGDGSDTITFQKSALSAGGAIGGGTGDDLLTLTMGKQSEIETVGGDAGADNITIAMTDSMLGTIDGGDDNDTIQLDGVGGNAVSLIAGGEGDDSINIKSDTARSTFTIDQIAGGGGNDTIKVSIKSVRGEAGVPDIDGGTGDDFVSVSRLKVDQLAGGDGFDTLVLKNKVVLTTQTFAFVTAGFEAADMFDTRISTTATAVNYDFSGAIVRSGFVEIAASDGDDTVVGTTGSDHLFGHVGNDLLKGAEGADTIDGQDGIDMIFGGLGNDFMTIGDGDTGFGGGGDDSLSSVGGALVNGGRGNDTITLTGIQVLHNNTIKGAAGADTVVIGQSSASTTITVAADAFTAASTSCEKLGTVGPVEIDGDDNANIIDLDSFAALTSSGSLMVSGMGGDDIVRASRASNVFGGDGNDVLVTGAGSANGGSGDDAITSTGNAVGGSGSDIIVNSGTTSTVDGGDGDDAITGGRTVSGRGGADALTANSAANTYQYFAVSESTSAGHDTVTGFDASNDKFSISGHAGAAVDAALTSGSISEATFDHDMSIAVDLTRLAANHALLFAPDGGDDAGKAYLIVDANGEAGYQASADYVIELTNAVNMGSFGSGNFI